MMVVASTSERMTSQIVLEYPNGRRYATVVTGDVGSGFEFELYGRRWQALGPLQDWQTRNQAKLKPSPILCISLGRLS